MRVLGQVNNDSAEVSFVEVPHPVTPVATRKPFQGLSEPVMRMIDVILHDETQSVASDGIMPLSHASPFGQVS
jgi:hypothetical protein